MKKAISIVMALVVCGLLLVSASSSLDSSGRSSANGVGVRNSTTTEFHILVTINNLYNYFPPGVLWLANATDYTDGYHVSVTGASDTLELNLTAVLGGVNRISVGVVPPQGFVLNNITNPTNYYYINFGTLPYPTYLRVYESLTPASYPVIFVEKGLPYGTQWRMSVLSDTTGVELQSVSQQNFNYFDLEEGNYQYTLNPVPGYVSDQAVTGTFSVGYSPEYIFLSFSAHNYPVSIIENGLPEGTQWKAQVNGATQETEGTSIQFSLPNGTYSAAIGSVPGFESGMGEFLIRVNGSAVYQTVTFSKTVYPVTFRETGLPSGTYWNVAVNGSVMTSNTSSITFMEPNGSYSYHVFSVPGYHISAQNSGSLNIQGSASDLSVIFQQTFYKVQFNTSGLPAYMNWSVSIAGHSIKAIGNSNVSVFLPNGTYYFKVMKPESYTAYVAGGFSVRVDGTDVFVAVQFIKSEYSVNISEMGLPEDSAWMVSFDNGVSTGITYSSQTGVMLPNGTFSYTVQSFNRDYRPSEYYGLVNISGNGIVISMNFVPVEYVQSFVIINAVHGSWSVLINGQNLISNGPMITTYLQNGTYTYAVHYGNTTITGTLTVSGGSSLLLIGSSGTLNGGNTSYPSFTFMAALMATIFIMGAIIVSRK